MMMMIMMIMMMMMMIVMQRITAHLLSTTVQKQPVGLSLDWSSLGKQQLNWLVFIYYLFIYTTLYYLHSIYIIYIIYTAAAAAPDQAAEPGGPGLHPDGLHPQHLQLSPAPGGLGKPSIKKTIFLLTFVNNGGGGSGASFVNKKKNIA